MHRKQLPTTLAGGSQPHSPTFPTTPRVPAGPRPEVISGSISTQHTPLGAQAPGRQAGGEGLPSAPMTGVPQAGGEAQGGRRIQQTPLCSASAAPRQTPTFHILLALLRAVPVSSWLTLQLTVLRLVSNPG